MLNYQLFKLIPNSHTRKKYDQLNYMCIAYSDYKKFTTLKLIFKQDIWIIENFYPSFDYSPFRSYLEIGIPYSGTSHYVDFRATNNNYFVRIFTKEIMILR